ncbi:MAG: glycosyltransferase family 4 protein [Candidatus Krumholzibacteriia bacterium]
MSLPRLDPPTTTRSGGRRVRVLMGVPAPRATEGGIALTVPLLVEDLRRAGHVDLETVSYGRWADGERRPIKVWHQVVDLLRYPSRVRRTDPDVVHLNTSLDRRALLRDIPFTLVTRLLGRPLLIQWHGSETHLLSSRMPIWRLLTQLLVRFVTALGVFSKQEESEIHHSRSAARCFVVKNAIDLRRYARNRALHSQLGIEAGAPLILFIGRLIPGKGLADVVRAMPQIASRFRAHLVVVGDGPMRARARRLVRELGLEQSVHFTGQIRESETLHFYCGCDVLVFPSTLTEGLPMALLQALAAGLGIVTTRLRAAVDYLREPENCLFVEGRDPQGVARALSRLLGEARLLERMRRHNLELARRFDRQAVAQEFTRIYRELANGSPAAAHGALHGSARESSC